MIQQVLAHTAYQHCLDSYSSQSKVNYHYMEGEITLTLSLRTSQAILKRINTKTGYYILSNTTVYIDYLIQVLAEAYYSCM